MSSSMHLGKTMSLIFIVTTSGLLFALYHFTTWYNRNIDMREISRKPVRKFKMIPLKPPKLPKPPLFNASDMDSDSSSEFDIKAICKNMSSSSLENVFSPRPPRVQNTYFKYHKEPKE